MIDFVQDLKPTSRTEEFRIFLISLVRHHNATSTRGRIFLYRPRDLESGNYWDTFNFIRSDLFEKSRKRQRVMDRQKFDRHLDEGGVVKIRGSERIEFGYVEAPADLLRKLRSIVSDTE